MSGHPISELTAYLDGALAPAERAAVEAHLTACASCRAERDRLTSAMALLARLPAAPEPSGSFEARFHARLAAERASARPRGLLDRLAWRWMAPGLVGAAAAASIFLYVGAQRREHEAMLASHLELFESYEAVASVGIVERPEDVEVVAHLDELMEGRP